MVSEPTRANNILDLVLCNNPFTINDCLISEPLGSSDHRSVCFSITVESPAVFEHGQRNYTLQRDFSRADFDGFKSIFNKYQLVRYIDN